MYAAQSMRNKWSTMLGSDFGDDENDQDSLKVSIVFSFGFNIRRFDIHIIMIFIALFLFSSEVEQYISHTLAKEGINFLPNNKVLVRLFQICSNQIKLTQISKFNGGRVEKIERK